MPGTVHRAVCISPVYRFLENGHLRRTGGVAAPDPGHEEYRLLRQEGRSTVAAADGSLDSVRTSFGSSCVNIAVTGTLPTLHNVGTYTNLCRDIEQCSTGHR